MLPVTQHPQADEVGLLPLDLFGGVGAAEFAHPVAFQPAAIFQFDLVLDGKAVAIPARCIRCVEAGQGLSFDDDVLEDLVDRVADVYVVVRVRRAVVQNEFRPALGYFADFFVTLLFLPRLDPARLAPGEIAAHGEGRVGKVEGFLVISHKLRLHHRDTEKKSVHVFAGLCASVSLWFRKNIRASSASRAICAVSAGKSAY